MPAAASRYPVAGGSPAGRCLAWLVCGCLTLLALPVFAAVSAGDAKVLIPDVPHVLQRNDFCGEACVEMICRRLGKNWTQDDVFNQSGVDPLLARGCYTAELATALTAIGFKLGPVAVKVKTTDAAQELEAGWQEIYADLQRSIPSIVCMHVDAAANAPEHFRLILGYDPKNDEVIYHDPAIPAGSFLRMKKELFLRLWPLKYSATQWTVIRFRCEPGTLAAAPPHKGITAADYAQHMMTLRKRIGARPFAVVLCPPFVVIGDESADLVKEHATNTVKWAVDRLRKDYFSQDPSQIIDIWLFKDKASYEKNTKALFNETPTTPYGFYSAANAALIMNIATGGGTLVHEIVHPFMRVNFPACPAWFNEGMGSLFEQCGERNGHAVGLTNWRLAGLQETIKGGALPSFKQLTATTDDAFYNRDKGSNYAQARYLCYYLQEHDLLVRFYDAFRRNHTKDPTGYAALQSVLGEKDMVAFEKHWQEFVLGLTFP